jgi:(5-formylfuran-3-yl)methyl phosphate synthase
MKLLISVRTVAEALAAAQGGADFIDLKEPRMGALGALPLNVIRDIVQTLRQAGHKQSISATIGDVPMQALSEIQQRVRDVAACGVNIVKVGILAQAETGLAHNWQPNRQPNRQPKRQHSGQHTGQQSNDSPADTLALSQASAVLRWLAGSGVCVVPLFIADAGLNFSLVQTALGLRFYGVMVDTQNKTNGSLLELLPQPSLAQFVTQARQAQVLVGLAGALRQKHLPALQALAPDFVGFRGAVCDDNERTGVLNTARVAALRAALARD